MNVPLNIDWQQIVLHLLNFVILAGGLYLLLYKPVKRFMDAREEHYRSMDARAEQTLKEAEDIKADYQKKLHAVEAEAEEKRNAAQRNTDRSIQSQLAQARIQADKIVSDAHSAAAREHEKMLAEAQDELKQLAVMATGKLLLQSKGDPYDQFLELTERSDSHE